MTLALQNALTGLASIVSLYILLGVVGKAIQLFFDLKVALNREKDMEMFARALGSTLKKDEKDDVS